MDRIVQKHSGVLVPLTISKMIERIGYYGMRSLIMLYLVRGPLQFTEQKAFSIYGIFMLTCTLMPLLGGVIGDFVLGSKRTSILGACVQALGCFILMVPNSIAVYAGLFFVSLGVGLYNPNIISTIAQLYQGRLKLMDAAMIVFYIAINLGAFLGAVLIGNIGDFLGYQVGFAFAGILIITSSLLLIFMKNIPGRDDSPIPEEKSDKEYNLAALILSIILVPFFWVIIQLNEDFAFELSKHLGDKFLSALNMINPIVIVIGGVVFAVLWSFVNIASLFKLSIGFFACSLSLGLMFMADQSGSGVVFLIISAILLQSAAELFISPIALSYIARYAPQKVRSLLIAGYLVVPGLLSYLLTFSYVLNDLSSTVRYLISIIIIILIGVVFLVLCFASRKTHNT